MQTVPEHEADCPICQAGHKDHCTDREVAQDFEELRAELEAVKAERDEALAALGDGWVPVGERLPDDSVAVLMWSPSQGMYLGSFDAGFWFADNGPMPEEMEVTHWRELPAPPEVKP